MRGYLLVSRNAGLTILSLFAMALKRFAMFSIFIYFPNLLVGILQQMLARQYAGVRPHTINTPCFNKCGNTLCFNKCGFASRV